MAYDKKKMQSEIAKIKHEMTQFLSSAKNIDYYVMEDIVDECQSKVSEYLLGESEYSSVEEIVWDYLELGELYAWIFVASVIPEILEDEELDLSEESEAL